MTFARAVSRAFPAIWTVIVLVGIVGGATATTPGGWAASLFVLVFFLVASWRFLVPGLVLAPAPAAPIAAIGVVAVAVRGWWVDGAVTDGVTDSASWAPLLLAVVAVVAAVLGPATGVRDPIGTPLTFPLREGRWLAVEGNGRIVNHHWPARRQQGAFDLVRLSRWGRSRAGFLRSTDDDFHAFGTPVVAPCDGRVTVAIDGIPDGVPDTARPAGNHVVIDTGREKVVLAHLRAGTVAVASGDTVASGDHLGEVGNSGNSTEPHLHIHAERDGRPLRLVFSDVRGRVGKGAVIRAGSTTAALPDRMSRTARRKDG